MTSEPIASGELPGCPLPRRSILGGPVIEGTIKVRAEDFLVEELPLYDPVGKGEHLYLGIRKYGMPHTELVRLLRQHECVKVHGRREYDLILGHGWVSVSAGLS